MTCQEAAGRGKAQFHLGTRGGGCQEEEALQGRVLRALQAEEGGFVPGRSIAGGLGGSLDPRAPWDRVWLAERGGPSGFKIHEWEDWEKAGIWSQGLGLAGSRFLSTYYVPGPVPSAPCAWEPRCPNAQMGNGD